RPGCRRGGAARRAQRGVAGVRTTVRRPKPKACGPGARPPPLLRRRKTPGARPRAALRRPRPRIRTPASSLTIGAHTRSERDKKRERAKARNPTGREEADEVALSAA